MPPEESPGMFKLGVIGLTRQIQSRVLVLPPKTANVSLLYFILERIIVLEFVPKVIPT